MGASKAGRACGVKKMRRSGGKVLSYKKQKNRIREASGKDICAYKVRLIKCLRRKTAGGGGEKTTKKKEVIGRSIGEARHRENTRPQLARTEKKRSEGGSKTGTNSQDTKSKGQGYKKKIPKMFGWWTHLKERTTDREGPILKKEKNETTPPGK